MRNKMKKIIIMCNGRTGSSFLTSHIKHKPKMTQYNAWEFFECWSPHFFKHVNYLAENNIPQPASFIDFFTNYVIFTQSEDFQDRVQLKYNKKPYNIKMLDDFSKILQSLGHKYFIHKHITHSSRLHGWNHSEIIDIADCIVINYRTSLLDTWISQTRANSANKWVTREYDAQYENKIKWSKSSFMHNARKYKENYVEIIKAVKESGKPHFFINYEDFCKVNNRKKFLEKQFDDIGCTDIILQRSEIVKQSTSREHYESCFDEETVEQFMEDYHEIKEMSRHEI